MKTIVMLLDGTWNTPDQSKDGIPVPTNVAILSRHVLPENLNGEPQVFYYDTGVGSVGKKLERLLGGATGIGLSAKLRQAYEFLCHHYEPGDQICLFGFSRGAYTARSLSGLIRNCGILRNPLPQTLKQAIWLYRRRDKGSHPAFEESTLFRKTYSYEDITPIHFIGVWDTVGALGVPKLFGGFINFNHRFHDTTLSHSVRYAFHALAVDEHRAAFQATLWTPSEECPTENLEQRWFNGVHGDVGGGRTERAHSDRTLCWMVDKARECGIGISPFEYELKAPTTDIGDTYNGIYRLQPRANRAIKDTKQNPYGNENIDPSVFERAISFGLANHIPESEYMKWQKAGDFKPSDAEPAGEKPGGPKAAPRVDELEPH